MKNKIFIFKRTQNEYLVLGEGELKHPETREWLAGVIYQSKDTGKIYVREKQEFLERFDEKL